METTRFWNDREVGTGTIVTSYRSRFYGECIVLYAKNPYGTHNLVVCVRDKGALELWTAGNRNSLAFIRDFSKNNKAYHKAMLFLENHGFDFKPRDIKTITSYRKPGAYVPYWQIKRDYLTPKWVLELEKYYRGGRISKYPEYKRDYTPIVWSEDDLEEELYFRD